MGPGGPHPRESKLSTGLSRLLTPGDLLVVVHNSLLLCQVPMGVCLFGNRVLARRQVVRYQVFFSSVLERGIRGQRHLLTAAGKATGGWILRVLLGCLWRKAIAVKNIQGVHTVNNSCSPWLWLYKWPKCALHPRHKLECTCQPVAHL